MACKNEGWLVDAELYMCSVARSMERKYNNIIITANGKKAGKRATDYVMPKTASYSASCAL